MLASASRYKRVSLRALLTLAAPVVLSRLGIMTMGLVDTIVVGRHSSTELGYLALAWAPTGIVLTAAIGMLQGIQVLTSQAIGAGRAEDTGAVLRRGLVYAFWVGCVAAAVLVIGGGPVMQHIGLEASLGRGATPVLQTLALSMLPIMLADAGIFWLEAHGRAVPGMVCMWAANVVNLALNLWLVPGRSGFAVEGAVASAWSTALSRTALLVFVAAAIIGWRQARGFGVFRRAAADRAAWQRLRAVGYGAAASYAIEAGAFAGMTIVAGWLGVAAVASWAIITNVMGVIFMASVGLATSTAVLVGQAYGARNAVDVRRAGALGFGATAALMVIVSAAVSAGASAIAAAYTYDLAVQRLTTDALLLAAWLFFLADGLQVVAAQSLRARGDIWLPAATHFFSYIAVLLPAGYIGAVTLGLGVDGIIWGTTVASAVAATLLLGRFAWLSRRAPA